jgi:hypothetical protein
MTHTKFETMLENGFIIKEEDLPKPRKTDYPPGLAIILALCVYLAFMGGLSLLIHL